MFTNALAPIKKHIPQIVAIIKSNVKYSLNICFLLSLSSLTNIFPNKFITITDTLAIKEKTNFWI